MISRVLRASALFRQRFGNYRGFILWLSLLREKLYRKGEVFRVRVPGVRSSVLLRAHTSDVETLCQIFAHGELDVSVTHDVAYIIDAGANIGLASVYFANRFPRARIDALEVDAGNVRMLRLNAAPYPNIVVHPKGLWSHETRLRVLNLNAEPWAFRVGEAGDLDSDAVPALSVGDLVRLSGSNHVDLLKIDIEGAEVEVLEASAAWIDKIRMLLVELHDRERPGCSAALLRAVSDRRHSLNRSGEYHVVRFV